MIRFIDANCMIGTPMMPIENVPETKEQLIEVMDRCGIEKAMVYHAVSKECDALGGNELLKKEIDGSDRFISQWAFIPKSFEEGYTPDELLQKMQDNNVKSVRLFPQAKGYSLLPYSIGEFMKVFGECNIPVFIDRAQIGFDDLYNFCTTYPNVKIVLCLPGYDGGRRYYALLKACPNLYLDTSNYCAHNAIEDVCKHFGAQRLIFGSGLPTGAPTAGVSLIRYANISDSEKKAIASENIISILDSVRL